MNIRVIFRILAFCSVASSRDAMLYGLIAPGITEISRGEINDLLVMQGMEPTAEVIDGIYSLAEMGLYYALFICLVVVGVVLMLRRVGVGLHIYLAALLGCVGAMVIAVGWGASVYYILWSILWADIYATLRKRLSKSEDKAEQ